MPKDAHSEYRITDPAQIRELISPVRVEILDAMAAIAPCSIGALAEELGRPADSLYYHVRKLLGCGLLVEAEGEERGARGEAVYDVPARRMYLEHDDGDAERMRLIADASSAMLRLSDRNLRATLLSGESTGQGDARRAWAGRSRAWLTSAELESVNGLVEQISEIYFGAEKREGTELHSFSFAMSPLPVGRRRRREGREDEETAEASS